MNKILKYKSPTKDYDGPVLEFVLKQAPPKVDRSIYVEAAIDGIKTILICVGIICYLGFVFAGPFFLIGWLLRDILVSLLNDAGAVIVMALLMVTISMCLIIVPINIFNARDKLNVQGDKNDR